MTKKKTESRGSAFMGIFSDKDIQVKRKYGKHPAKFINIKKLINEETAVFSLLPKVPWNKSGWRIIKPMAELKQLDDVK